MQRPIKFRAWDKIAGKMYYDVTVEPDGFIWEEGSSPFNSRMAFLMQYTGLKDKNDKEIYEGDIVECQHGEVGIIEYDDHYEGGGCFRPTSNTNFCEIFYDKERWYYLEIIGNIRENPELMEDTNVK